MPRYTKGRGRKKLVKKKKRFGHPYDVLHALAATPPERFQKYRDLAGDYLSGNKVPPAALSRDALSQMVNENQQYLASQAAQVLGLEPGRKKAKAVSTAVTEAVDRAAEAWWVQHGGPP